MASAMSKRQWRVILLGPALALVAAAATLAVDRETGILPVLQLLEQVRRADARVEALVAERGQLIRRVRGLRSDSFQIEAVARRELGMVRPGEVVIRFGSDDAETD